MSYFKLGLVLLNLNILNFLVVGTIRNCQRQIFQTIKCLDKGLYFANKIEYFFVESDSDDKTLDSLKKLSSQKNNFRYESFGRLRTKLPIHTERLALCRNRYLDELKSKKNSWVDYLIVVDADGVCKNINSQVIKKCISEEGWSAHTANVKGAYYDVWALRHNIWSPNDCWKATKEELNIGFSRFDSESKNVYSRMIKINSSQKIIAVDSAFGGLAIYRKLNIPDNARYIGLSRNGEIICEHISFHNSIKQNKGSIFINPKLIIGPSPYAHTKYSGILGLNRFWARCFTDSAIDRFRKSYIKLQNFLKIKRFKLR